MPTHLISELLARAADLRERGATAVEYALLASLVAAVIAGTVALIGPALLPGFEAVIDGLP